MTRYNITVLDEAFGASDDHVKVPDIERIFDTLDRAPWWEEVTDGNTVVPAGCPVRREVATGDATERTYASPFTAWQWLGKARVFIDTRWTPPKQVYKVGDVIEECTDATLPADGVGLVDMDGDLCQIYHGRVFVVGYVDHGWTSLNDATPFTVIYVPEEEV